MYVPPRSPCLAAAGRETISGMEVKTLANVKSAKKRILVNQKKAARNKAAKSAVKTQVKKVYNAIASGDQAAARTQLDALKSIMGKAAQKGIDKKNTFARKISRVARDVNKAAE